MINHETDPQQVIADKLLERIRMIGLKALPFDIQPRDVIDSETNTQTSDLHSGAKLAMDKPPIRKANLAIWLDEMPGEYKHGTDGLTYYDGTPPVFRVRRGIRTED